MSKLRVVILSPWFGENMGYIENRLPPALARLGGEVHVVTSQLQPHFSRLDYKQTYEPLNGPAVLPAGVFRREGFTLHRLPYHIVAGYVALRGLRRTLRRIRPAIVQNFTPVSWPTMQAAMLRPQLGYRLFTGAHRTASTFPLPLEGKSGDLVARFRILVSRTIPGRLLSLATERCYAATTDCETIAARYYGVQRDKLNLLPLGVDTSRFHPPQREEDLRKRQEIRAEFGFDESDIVCIYTGRLSADKDPRTLSRAIDTLASSGSAFRGLFVGAGEYETTIAQCNGCVVRPFVRWTELPDLYRAADIGVWPHKESMSMLDAAACGLPIVVSDRVLATERHQGNGLTYGEGDSIRLGQVLRQLQDEEIRRELGSIGARKMRRSFSWDANASVRLKHYYAAVGAADS